MRTWDRWTGPRAAVAGVWLVAVTGAAWFAFVIGALTSATLFGEPPSRGQVASGVALIALAGGIATLGPLGIWWMRRSRPWGWATGLLGALAVALVIWAALAVDWSG